MFCDSTHLRVDLDNIEETQKIGFWKEDWFGGDEKETKALETKTKANYQPRRPV